MSRGRERLLGVSRAAVVVAIALAIVWALIAGLYLPWLVSEAYAGRGPGVLQRIFAEKRAYIPLAYYLIRLRLLAAGGAVGIAAAVLAFAAAKRDVERGGPLSFRLLPRADAASLAGIRIGVCAIAFLLLAIEDPASTTLLPRNGTQPAHVQVMAILRQFSFVDALLGSAAALSALKLATLATLGAAIFGFYTRAALALSVVGLLAVGGVLRMYTHFFHTGILPLYLIGVLCLAPCADAWALDPRRRVKAGLPAAEGSELSYTWARFACWSVIALTYFAAGTSKLRHGGLLWWDGVNLKHKLLSDALNMNSFDLPFASLFASLPTSFYAVLGLGTLVVEVGFLFVPVSRLARRYLPLGAVGLHLGIFLAQEILFLDLLLIHVVFYDHRARAERAAAWVLAKLPPGVAAVFRAGGAESPTSNAAGGTRRPGRPSSTAVATLALIPVAYAGTIALGIEFYPVTTWGMYSDRTKTSVVEYTWFRGIDSAGRTVAVRFEDAFGALRFNRTYDIIPRAFDPKTQGEVHAMLARYAEIHNRESPATERLAAIELDLRAWDFIAEPDHPEHGRSIKQFVHRVAAGDRAEAP